MLNFLPLPDTSCLCTDVWNVPSLATYLVIPLHLCVHHRRGLVWTESWMIRSKQLPIILKRVISFPWLFWKWRHRLFIGAPWYRITENKKIWAQLERDKGRQYSGNGCLGLLLVRIPAMKLVRPWWALSACSWAEISVAFFILVMKAPDQESQVLWTFRVRSGLRRDWPSGPV